MDSPRTSAARKPREDFNQPPPLVGHNLYLTDAILQAALHRSHAAWAEPQLQKLGAFLGTEEAQRWGFDANENEPVLETHDRFGNRRDEVVFHPSWHHLMRTSIEHRLHSLPWIEPRLGSHAARAALLFLAAQNEAGHLCPVSMTFSSVASFRADPDLAARWEPLILSSSYDPRFRPAHEKSGILVGMGMTERQGGSDLRANTTRAEPLSAPKEFLITGHKWFCSAPMCDAFLILAQAPKGLSCFFLPRWTPAGDRNAFHIQRLKRKMGNRSNASSEVEFAGAWASLVGEEGRGVHTIIEMVQHTRLDCAISSAALMRQALVQAVHHARHRKAFGKLLIDQPLMRNVLTDLALESEAATLLAIRLASAFDLRAAGEEERAFARVATAVAKYWLCKRAPVHVGEALECLGGNGYVEESIMPRLYREAPLYGIWEGSGNVICLDILRAISKEPLALDALLHEIRLASPADPRLHAFASDLDSALFKFPQPAARDSSIASEGEARILAEKLALALQASLMVRFATPAAADAFCLTRLGTHRSHTFGTLPSSIDPQPLLASICDHLPA
jgi:putative acyl-CoA dehydrogenase